MRKITRDQEQALMKIADLPQTPEGTEYADLRESVVPLFGSDSAITVPWCGMWLVIDANGYTHS